MDEAWSELMDRVERAHGVVTTLDLLAAGLSKAQIQRLVASGRLVSNGHGSWRVRGAPDSREARILGAVAALEGEVWASHRTAAWLHSIPVFGPPGLIEVTRLNGMSANRSGLLVRRSTLVLPHHVTKVRGIDCTAIPRTVFDLARLAGPKALDRAIDHVLRHDMCTVGALHVVTAELGGRGRPGTVKMRTALEARDDGYLPSDSELTALGRQVLSAVPGVEWEVEISDERGYIRRVDAFVRPAGLVVEFDGRRWHGQPSDVRRDEEADMRLEALGLVVLRLTWAELTRRPDAVVVKVLRLAAGGVA